MDAPISGSQHEAAAEVAAAGQLKRRLQRHALPGPPPDRTSLVSATRPSGSISAARSLRPALTGPDTAPATHRELGLTDAEFELIVDKLGREPNDVELAMFSLLWSEHCAYKHSRKLLRRLPTEGERVLMGPGENAGAVSVGDGWAVAFKVESHNHPSAVEPFQGAATGVGGILRDVFALGARPIAVLDSLRFGELDSERSRYLFDQRRRRDRPLRQLDRGADGRRRGLLRASLRAELPRQRDVRRARARRPRWSAPPPPGSATRSC